MFKRLFDIIFSLIGLIVLSPILLLAAILIKKEDNGPIFYAGKRVGKGGELFPMLKLRTMIVDADKIGASSTPSDDPRLTKTGKFLRKYKLDEIPQLINVLKGDMSFVGPRPQVKWVMDMYTDEQKEVLQSVRPGITNEASIKFSNEDEILKGSTDPDKDYWEKIHPEKMRLSMNYVRSMTFSQDLKILLKTFLCVMKRGTKT